MNRANSVLESSQKLELFISCRSLADMDTFSKSDPYVILYLKKNNQWFEHSRTETIMDNLNPNFAKSILLDYFFEVQQPLKFVCYDYDGPNSSEVITPIIISKSS
jgi:Ca2+-dependent lipid-binding protein